MSQVEGVEDIAGAVAGIDLNDMRAEDDERIAGEIRDRQAERDSAAISEIRNDLSLRPMGGHAADALFESGAYLQVPVMDGHPSDKLVFAFGGSINFEAGDPEGRDLFEKLTLGRDVELRVSGFVGSKQGSFKKGKDDEEIITGKVGVKIDSIYVLGPEDL